MHRACFRTLFPPQRLISSFLEGTHAFQFLKKILGIKNIQYSCHVRPHIQSLSTTTENVYVVSSQNKKFSHCFMFFMWIWTQKVVLRETSGSNILNSHHVFQPDIMSQISRLNSLLKEWQALCNILHFQTLQNAELYKSSNLT